MTRDAAVGELTKPVETRCGLVQGLRNGAVEAFLGIPYAAPPYRANRFAEPRAATPWTGVRCATAYGPTAPKSPYPPHLRALLPDVAIDGADCLNLNVWRPAVPPEEALPVLVWLHGGAFTNGSGADAEYAGTAFARDGVVCVTLNYRLGADGFLILDDAPDNRALRDIVFALQWVRDNIASFYGDPDRVTLMGESAGAMAVASLLVAPPAKGLFARAILQSGAASDVQTRDHAEVLSDRLCGGLLGVPATREAVGAVPMEQLLAAAAALAADVRAPGAFDRYGRQARLQAFAPSVDGDVMPGLPDELAASGTVPILLGTNRDESRLLYQHRVHDITEAELEEFGRTWDVADLGVFGEGTPGEILIRGFTQVRFVDQTRRLIAARGSLPTWEYVFDGIDPHTNNGLGSCHTTEVPLVFETWRLPELRARLGQHRLEALADNLHGIWVRFVSGADVGWAEGTRALLNEEIRSDGVAGAR